MDAQTKGQLTGNERVVEQALVNVSAEIDKFFHYAFNYVGLEYTQLFASKWLHALLLLVVFVLTAYLVRSVLRVFDQYVHDRVFVIVRRLVFHTIILFGFIAALATFDVAKYSILKNVFLSVFWILWGVNLIKIAKIVLRQSAYDTTQKRMLKPETLPLFSNLSIVFIFSLFFYFFLITWEVDMTALIASAGMMGLAAGFAAKDTLANLFSGVFILADQPYKMGDFVVLDTGERGEITHIGIRSTRMLTRDDIEITIPNAIMGNAKIVNESGGYHTKSRVRVKVSVAYGSDTQLVRSVLMRVASEGNGVCLSPVPRVRFRAFNNYGLDFELLCWIRNPVLRGQVLDGLNEQVHSEFMRAKIEIPYPKQDMYIKQMPNRQPSSKNIGD